MEKVLNPNLTNITRSLAINAYQVWDQRNNESVECWFDELQEKFSAEKLSGFVTNLSRRIGARILSVSSAPYEPYGASAALLVGQEQHYLAHLDASHIAAHSYFEASDSFALFRLEIEISTCGSNSPQMLINDVLEKSCADFLQLDYRVRGAVWNSGGGPNLAREELDHKALKFDGYTCEEYSSPGRGACYAELIRSDPGLPIRTAIEEMRK